MDSPFLSGLRLPAVIASALLLASCANGGGTRTVASSGEYKAAVKAVTLLKTGTTSAGTAIPYPRTNRPEVTGLLVEIPPGKETGWHKHTCPGYAYIIEGNLTVQAEGGIENHYGPGEAFAEMVNKNHNGQNRGRKTVRLIAFFTGEKDHPITIKAR